MPWWIYALIASLSWGASYPLTEKALGVVSQPTLMTFYGLVAILLFGSYGVFSGKLAVDVRTLLREPHALTWLALLALSIFAANLAIMQAIAGRNATLAAMVEAAYICFIPAFAWLITGATGLSWITALGSALIATGVLLLARFG